MVSGGWTLLIMFMANGEYRPYIDFERRE